MTLLDYRGFGERSVSTAQPAGWSTDGAGIGYGTGRFAGSTSAGTNGVSLIFYTVPGGPATIVTGAAVQINATTAPFFMGVNAPAGGASGGVLTAVDVVGGLVALVWKVGGVTIATSAATFPKGVWMYVEIKVAAGVGGAVEIRVDGVAVISLTGGAQTVGASILTTAYCYSSNQSGLLTDIYICDTAGAGPFNDFLGDVRCDYLPVNNNGTSSQLVGSDGNSVNNYLLVDEAPALVADYVQSATVGQRDTYAVTDIVSTADTVVYAAKTMAAVFKSDAGTAKVKAIIKSGASESLSAAAVLSTTMGTITTPISTAKPGGGTWSVSDINAAEVGVEVSA